ncbi:tryptophan 2,3-dioxygenase [Natronosporangium hydrolyticum]|uniref:Tryptophan 2,3-dioxygenase n=1 Tax=Natronosporangium hydrolyticum TaxID=2811111 RepID=A0A895Y8F8_9ACTN|nr:tryptophan 2,3-dioxygenase family protein [Natronosporangium hydrolyticum]QSB13997.1 tryptophan 2,3-dioxygenase [Natronosporangium hydrolyticum]
MNGETAAGNGHVVATGTSHSGSYEEFLHLDELFAACQQVPDHPDGRFFVMAHQAFELWFELLLHELEQARDDLLAERVEAAQYRLRRVVAVDRLLLAQLDTLTTISPQQFAGLRPSLGTASGLESTRFREIELLSGLVGRHLPTTVASQPRVRRRRQEPTLWDAYRKLVRRRGFAEPADVVTCDHRSWELTELAEALLDHDEAWVMWRVRHAVVVERIIGHQPGTGGSTGVGYLRSRRDDRFFPDLWQARTRLR